MEQTVFPCGASEQELVQQLEPNHLHLSPMQMSGAQEEADPTGQSSQLRKEPESGSAEPPFLKKAGKEQPGTAAPSPSGMAHPLLRPEIKG